jgi:hypothetical protein
MNKLLKKILSNKKARSLTTVSALLVAVSVVGTPWAPGV